MKCNCGLKNCYYKFTYGPVAAAELPNPALIQSMVDAAAAQTQKNIAEALSISVTYDPNAPANFHIDPELEQMLNEGYEPVQGGEVPFDPPCDCGGEKAGTTHSTWCGRYR
jgi:hypothetical protein